MFHPVRVLGQLRLPTVVLRPRSLVRAPGWVAGSYRRLAGFRQQKTHPDSVERRSRSSAEPVQSVRRLGVQAGASARSVLRRAQHRHRLAGQHLNDRDVRRKARAEVRVQGPRPGHKPEPGHGVADDLFPVEGRAFLINQVEQLAVLEDQAPARAYGNRVVESPGVVVDDEQSSVGLLQETEAQVR